MRTKVMHRVIDFSRVPAKAPVESTCQRLERMLAGYHHFLAHDLVNQLIPIQAFGRMLAEQAGPTLDPDTRILLDRMVELSQRVNQSAGRLGELGRLLREGTGSPVPLEEVVLEAVTRVRMAARQRFEDVSGPVVVYDRDSEIDPVIIRGRLVTQVLVELLANALHAVAGRTPSDPVTLTARTTGTEIGLSVRDRGPGIAESQLVSLGMLEGSPGLGYFFILQAVAICEGCLRIETDPSEGTTVTLLLSGTDA